MTYFVFEMEGDCPDDTTQAEIEELINENTPSWVDGHITYFGGSA